MWSFKGQGFRYEPKQHDVPANVQRPTLNPPVSPNVSIIIVSWNVRELLRQNLARLLQIGETFPLEIFVVDNDSRDGTREMVRAEFPSVRLLVNAWNAGFAAACNRAARLASGEVILLLNPDMLVEPGAIERTYKELVDHVDVGVVGAQLVGQDKKPIHSVRRDPSFSDQLFVLLKLTKRFPRVMDQYLANDFDYTKTQDVEQVRGSFFAFRRALGAELGFLDERYFIWFEEVDFCRRVRGKGLKIRYLSEALAHDAVGQSFKQQSFAWKQRQFSRSMALYFSRWAPAWQAGVIWALRPGIICAAAIHDFFL